MVFYHCKAEEEGIMCSARHAVSGGLYLISSL